MEPAISVPARGRVPRLALLTAVLVVGAAGACSDAGGTKTLRASGGSVPGEVSTTIPTAVNPTTDVPSSPVTTAAPAPTEDRPTVETPQPVGPAPDDKPRSSPRSYPRGGPVDNVIPPSVDANTLLTSAQGCTDLLGKIDGDPANDEPSWRAGGVDPSVEYLYRAAANVCLLRWIPAESAFSQIGSLIDICDDEGDDPDCMTARSTVYEWTYELLAAHRADPNFVPVFV